MTYAISPNTQGLKSVTNTETSPNPEWLGGDDSDAINAQIKQGQMELAESDVLPMTNSIFSDEQTRFEIASLGIYILCQVPGDPLFYYCILPKGWSKVPDADEPTFVKIVDEKGRIRAHITYKAAFYDRKASINASHRITYETHKLDDHTVGSAIDTVTGEIILETGQEPHTGDGMEYKAGLSSADGICLMLDLIFPDWRNPLAYWEIDDLKAIADRFFP